MFVEAFTWASRNSGEIGMTCVEGVTEAVEAMAEAVFTCKVDGSSGIGTTCVIAVNSGEGLMFEAKFSCKVDVTVRKGVTCEGEFSGDVEESKKVDADAAGVAART